MSSLQSGFPCHLLADACDVPKQGGIRRWATGHHSLERRNPRIRQTKPSVIMVNHHVNAPVFGVFQLLEDQSVERLTNAQHEPFTGMNYGTETHDEFGVSGGLFSHVINKVPCFFKVGFEYSSNNYGVFGCSAPEITPAIEAPASAPMVLVNTSVIEGNRTGEKI
jgi:hypothetical protein